MPTLWQSARGNTCSIIMGTLMPSTYPISGGRSLTRGPFIPATCAKAMDFIWFQGGDPIPDADECRDMYRIALEKKGNLVRLLVEEVEVFSYVDDGETYGPCLAGGKIGFRQLAPMIAEYADLKVYAL